MAMLGLRPLIFRSVRAIASSVVVAITLVASAPGGAATPAATPEKIIISGASGHLGELVIKELLKRGVPATRLILVSRTPDKLRQYAAQGASARFGDVDKPESLAAAYAGGTKMLFISLSAPPGSPPRAPRQKIGFDAAVKAGVKLIVYTSMLNADTSPAPFAADQRQSEAYLKASGARWTILRNGVYAEFAVGGQAAKMLASGTVTVAPNEPKSAPVTREDCAAAAAGALTTPGHENKTYEITGPDLINRKDIAALVSEVTGRKIRVVEQVGAPIPYDFSLQTGTPTLSHAVQELAGRPATTMRAFVEANKATLLQMPQDQ
jgi:NAD(P)H dehydrogenase (quinone)